MKTMNLGGSGLKASEISLGCMRLNNLDVSAAEHLVCTAIEEGINLFDHADIYGGGECESLFGKVMDRNAGIRDKIYLQSKCGIAKGYYDFSPEYILKSVDGCLQRLHTDYLDVLLLHRPDALMEPELVAEALHSLQQSGKVRHFGVCNQNLMQMQLLQKYMGQKLIINQLQFGVKHTGMLDAGICANTEFPQSVDRDGGILDYCRLHEISIQAWSPYQYGMFEGVFLNNPKFPELNRLLDELAEKYEVTSTAIATAWILRHPAKIQTIAGTTREEHLKEVIRGCDITLTRPEWYSIYLAAGNILP